MEDHAFEGWDLLNNCPLWDGSTVIQLDFRESDRETYAQEIIEELIRLRVDPSSRGTLAQSTALL